MEFPLNSNPLASLALGLVLLLGPPALAEMRVVVAEDGTIQFVQVVDGAIASVEATSGAASVSSQTATVSPTSGALAEVGAVGSAVAAPSPGASVVASPSTSSSTAAAPSKSGSVLANPGEAAAVDAEPGDDGFADALPAPRPPPPPPVILPPEKADDPLAKALKAGEKISFGETVLFDTAKHELKPHAGPALDAVAKVLLAHQSIRVRIEGHTDSRGGEEYNQRLSERRANAVYRALLNRGVPARQMAIVGFGLKRPIDTNDTAAGRAKNRRVDLVPLMQERN